RGRTTPRRGRRAATRRRDVGGASPQTSPVRAGGARRCSERPGGDLDEEATPTGRCSTASAGSSSHGPAHEPEPGEERGAAPRVLAPSGDRARRRQLGWTQTSRWIDSLLSSLPSLSWPIIMPSSSTLA